MAAHVFDAAPEPASELGRYRILSSTAGIRVSPLCLGALSIGDAWKGVHRPLCFFLSSLLDADVEDCIDAG